MTSEEQQQRGLSEAMEKEENVDKYMEYAIKTFHPDVIKRRLKRAVRKRKLEQLKNLNRMLNFVADDGYESYSHECKGRCEHIERFLNSTGYKYTMKENDGWVKYEISWGEEEKPAAVEEKVDDSQSVEEITMEIK